MKNKRRSKNNKGFTLIELLAVIVIMGILMMAAMPLVLNQIQNSKVKSVVSSIDSYVKTIMGEANYLTYDFTAENTIFAIPIECIDLEQGGEMALGQWMQANNDYWAYVLVQYDKDAPTYNYAFTFKDSLGYSLYPTSIDKIKEKSNLIKLELDVTKPQTGLYTNYTSEENWEKSGFELNETTQLRVLEAESDGIQGDGVNTCTLCQKGPNYEQVEQEKQENNKPLYFNNHYVMNDGGNSYSYILSETGSVKYYNNCNLAQEYPTGTVRYDSNYVYIGDTPFAAISSDKKTLTMLDGGITFTLDEIGICPNPDDHIYADLPVMVSVKKFINGDQFIESLLPSWYNKIEQIKSVTFENKINIPNGVMAEDYSAAGNGKVMTFLRNHPTEPGYYDLVIQGEGKIYANPDSFYAFIFASYASKINNIELLDTSKVTNMSHMFSGVAIEQLNLSSFNTKNVTDMSYMFKFIGPHEIPNGNVTLNVGFDTSNVTNMEGMFYTDGTLAPIMTLNLGDKFNTSKVTNMSWMFAGLGYNNTSLTLNLGNKFDTRNVTNMDNMFTSAGRIANDFILDCSTWNVDKVISHEYFTYYEDKIIPPVWKH